MRFDTWWKSLCRLVGDDHPTIVVEGLTILDLREDRHTDSDQVAAVFGEALSYLREYDKSFHELVITNIDRVAVIDGPGEGVSWLNRTYTTALPVLHRRHTLYLAGLLVWAAGYFRALAPIPWYRRLRSRRGARASGRNSWRAFVRQFPNAEEWEKYLDAHGP